MKSNDTMKRIKGYFKHLPQFIHDDFYELFPMLWIDKRVKKFMAKEMDKKDHNAIVYRKDLEDKFKASLKEEELSDKTLIETLTYDNVKSYLLYGITPDEYFLYDFRNKSDKERAEILSRKRRDDIVCRKLGYDTREYFNQLKDKWTFYTLAAPFFKRDVVRVQEESDWPAVEDFCSRHSRFIAKPRLASSGIGVHIVDLQQNEWGGVRGLFDHYVNLDKGKWMFEEFIIQDESMAAWHPSSVNTIRVPSFKTKNGFKVLLPLFRTGKNGNLVDNCHNDGGLMSVPDAETGVLVSDGYDIYTNVVEVHPNSGMKFKGWQVPKWDELLKTTMELHKSMPPKHKYIGFDFALTPKGWVVVEGNWGNFPHQVCVGYGVRKVFEKLMKS